MLRPATDGRPSFWERPSSALPGRRDTSCGTVSRPAGCPGCQPRRGAFHRASLTAYNPKGDTLKTERPMLQCGFAISITALAVLATAITAVAAPYTLKSSQCYGACTAKCAAQHSCERYNATPASHITISTRLFVGLGVIVNSPPSAILRCETTSLPLARMHRSLDIMRVRGPSNEIYPCSPNGSR
jgi:hypothetical protein